MFFCTSFINSPLTTKRTTHSLEIPMLRIPYVFFFANLPLMHVEVRVPQSQPSHQPEIWLYLQSPIPKAYYHYYFESQSGSKK